MSRALRVLALLSCLVAVACAPAELPTSPGCQDLPLPWLDCVVRDTAPAHACPVASTPLQLQGRASNFERVAAQLCCSATTCTTVKEWSLERDHRPAAASELLAWGMR